MPEQLNIEYEQSWHGDYLKWVCGFAMQMGVSFISAKMIMRRWVVSTSLKN